MLSNLVLWEKMEKCLTILTCLFAFLVFKTNNPFQFWSKHISSGERGPLVNTYHEKCIL